MGVGLPEAGPFLSVWIVGEAELSFWQREPGGPRTMRWTTSVMVDRAGRAHLLPADTENLFSSGWACKRIPPEDVRKLEQVWAPLSPRRQAHPEPAYFMIEYRPPNLPAAAREPAPTFFIPKEGFERSSDLGRALEATLEILESAYGRRYVRELRAAGLDDLLPSRLASDGRDDTPKPEGSHLALSVPNEAVADSAFEALAAGGKVEMPLAKTFWSPRYGMVTDNFGEGHGAWRWAECTP